MKNTKLQNPSLRKRKGFTLIELIVVIAILAILAAIAVPTFLGTLNRSRWNTDTATARVIVSAAQVYFAEDGTIAQPTVAELIAAGYLDETPVCQYLKTGTFVINYSADKVINTVTDGTNQFYPKVDYAAPTTTTSSAA